MARSLARGVLRRAGLAALALVTALCLSVVPVAPDEAWAGKPYDVTAPEGDALAGVVEKAEEFLGWLKTDDGENAIAAGGKVEGVSAGLALYAQWKEIPTWAESDWDVIADLLDKHYKGEIDLTTYEGFQVGATREVHLSAMSASGSGWSVGESHAEQDVELVIMDKNLYPLANKSIDERNTTDNHNGQAAFVVGQKNCLDDKGYMNPSGVKRGNWESSARRAWCNSAYRAALPDELRMLLKQVDVVTAENSKGSTLETSKDYCFLPTEKEVLGTRVYSNETEWNSSSLSRWAYYSTSNFPVKTIGGSSGAWFLRSPSMSGVAGFCCIKEAGRAETHEDYGVYGLAPCFCI